MEIRCVPYCEVDGVRNFTDSFIKEIFLQICYDGNLDKVLHDGYIRTADAFLAYMKSKNVLPFLVANDCGVILFVWLTNLSNKTAFVNFTYLGDVPTRTKLRVGKQVLHYLLHIEGAVPGAYVFDGLYGITPVSNKTAWRFALNSGFKDIATIKKACLVNGESINGYLTYATREDL